MRQHLEQITLATDGQGLTEFTSTLTAIAGRAKMDTGLCTVFISHTSASLTIQENADPSARNDLQVALSKLAPENDPAYTHTAEGPDDMPSHIKSALTSTSLSIPIADGQLVLGTWQGVFLWEHRRRPHRRQVTVHLLGQ